jgi:hypothetical protein
MGDVIIPSQGSFRDDKFLNTRLIDDTCPPINNSHLKFFNHFFTKIIRGFNSGQTYISRLHEVTGMPLPYQESMK